MLNYEVWKVFVVMTFYAEKFPLVELFTFMTPWEQHDSPLYTLDSGSYSDMDQVIPVGVRYSSSHSAQQSW